MQGHQLTIYTENHPPWNYQEGGNIVGITTKIVKLIQNDINNSDVIEIVPWNRAYKSALERKNHILYTTARTKQREELFFWIGPIVQDRVYLFKSSSNALEVESLEDAKKVGTIDAGPTTNAAHMTLAELGFSNLSTLSRSMADFKSLKKGRSDLLTVSEYFFTYKALLEGFAKSDFENTGVLVFEYPLYIAISKGTDKSIVKKWQDSFLKLKKSGAIEKAINRELRRIEHDTKN